MRGGRGLARVSGVPYVRREVLQATATELARLIRNRELSAVEVVDSHLARIDEVNGTINAVVQLAAERGRSRRVRPMRP